ncbi:MAG: ATP-binding protein [Bdellovibrionota bacterium]
MLPRRLKTIQAKLSFFIALSVFFVAVLVTTGAAVMTWGQIQKQNVDRLQAAVASFQRSFQQHLTGDLTTISNFSKFQDVPRLFNSTALIGFAEDAVLQRVSELQSSLHADKVEVYLKEEAADQGFALRIVFDQNTSKAKYLAPSAASPALLFRPLEHPNFLVLRNKKLLLSITSDFDSPFTDPNYGLTEGLPIAKFVIEKPLDLNLQELDSDLGVHLNLYSVKGEEGEGQFSFPDLILGDDHVTNHVTQLKDSAGASYDTWVAPLEVGGKAVGFVSASLPRAETVQRIAENGVLLVGLALGIIAIIVALFIPLINRNIAEPLTRVSRVFTDLSEGVLDLGVSIPIESEDEIGDLVASFNKMSERLLNSNNDLSAAKKDLETLNLALEQRVQERTVQLEEAQRSALENAHAAGMAEISTSVLHNIGNIVNSANVSADIILSTTKNSKISGLAKANALLTEHKSELPDFFAKDPKAASLPDYYVMIGEKIRLEMEILSGEAEVLRKSLELVKVVIQDQQSYAKGGFFSEQVSLAELVIEALGVRQRILESHGVRVVQDFQDAPPLKIPRVRFSHVLINLIKNAREALAANEEGNRILKLSISSSANEVRLEISDNGVGISPENLKKIFNHGFTTKQSGHGFGLHFCANTMKELGGSLTVHSEGLGKGATFVLSFGIPSPA